jgi:hypothetical protein
MFILTGEIMSQTSFMNQTKESTNLKDLHLLNLDQHNVIDYLYVAVALAFPFIFGFYDVTQAVVVLYVISLLSLCKDLMTRYRYSIVKKIPIGIHMIGDLTVGTLIATTPFIFNYIKQLTDTQLTALFLFGFSSYFVVGLTRPRTEEERLEEIAKGEAIKVKSLRCHEDL